MNKKAAFLLLLLGLGLMACSSASSQEGCGGPTCPIGGEIPEEAMIAESDPPLR